MSLTRRNFFARIGAIVAGAVVAPYVPLPAISSIALKELYGVVDISWKVLEDSRADQFHFERALDQLDNEFRARVLRQLNADLLSIGPTKGFSHGA